VAVTTLIGNGKQPQVGVWGRQIGVEGDHRGGYRANGLQTPAGYVYGVAAARRGDVFVAGYTEAPLSGHIRWIKPNGAITSVWLPNYPLQTPTGVAVLQEPTDDPANPGWLVVADLAANRVYAVAIVEGPTGNAAARFPMRVLAGETEALYGLSLPPESPLLFEGAAPDGTTPARSRFRLGDEGKRQYAATGVRVREPARWAYLNAPRDVEVDELGNVYIADRRNHRVRMIAGEKAAGRTLYGYRTGYDDDGDGDLDRFDAADTPLAAGALYTIAGNPAWDPARTPDTGTGRWFGEFAGDGARAQSARLDQPNAIAYRDGYLYVSDTDNQRVRRISRATGVIETVVGKPAGSQRHDGTDYDFAPGTAGDGGAATAAQLSYPMGLGFDPKGRLFVADRDSGRLRMVAADGTLRSVAGRLHDPAAAGPLADQATDGEARFWADMFDTQGLDVDTSGNVLFCDGRHLRVRKLWRQWDME
jgi:sugar lactone lactonase YvrE